MSRIQSSTLDQLEEQREQAYLRMRREVPQIANGPLDRSALTDGERAAVDDFDQIDAAVRAARAARYAAHAGQA
jgi:hypothetical protein